MGRQITWASLLRSAKAGRLSDCRIGSLYSALADADAIIEAVRRYRHACSEGDMAAIQEEVGEQPGRSSESWFGEAEEAEQACSMPWSVWIWQMSGVMVAADTSQGGGNKAMIAPTTGIEQDRIGGWIQTISGRAFWPLDPRPDEIDIDDIAWSLSMQCRFAGHVKRFYSVAEHCVHVSRVVPAEFALWGLLHDATEAYLSDLVQPLKVCMPQYREWEDQLMQYVCERFGLSWPMPDVVKEIDRRMLFTEKAALLNPPWRSWQAQGEPLAVELSCWSHEEAHQQFVYRFLELA